MDRNLLIAQSPTAQVRMLAEDLLKDGRIHSRKEISEYIERQRKYFNLSVFSAGHKSGGIQQATANCEKLGRASYRLRTAIRDTSEAPAPISRNQTVVQILDHAVVQLSTLAREIDFISADAAEIRELEKLKSTVQSLNDMKRTWIQEET